MQKNFNAKFNLKIFIVIMYIFLLVFLYKMGFLTTDVNKLKEVVLRNPNLIITTFMLLSTLRVFIFIPNTVFCILSGLIFTPLKALILSTIGTIASLSIIFYIGKSFISKNIKKFVLKKYPYMESMLDQYGAKLFTVGLLCPIAPGDLLCLLLSTLNISFSRYLKIIIFTHVPWIILFTLVGNSVNHSFIGTLLLSVSILSATVYSFYFWNKIKNSSKEVS